MYKILIKYTSTSSKVFWEPYMVVNKEGKSVEFDTDDAELLKEELHKLDKIYGYENLRAVMDVTYTVSINMPNDIISIASEEEVSNIYDTAFSNVFGGN